MADVDRNFGDEVVEKLKEVAWFVAVTLLRFFLEKIVGGNPGPGEGDAEKKHE